MAVTCTRGKDGKTYYFSNGKRISKSEAMGIAKKIPTKCKLSEAAKKVPAKPSTKKVSDKKAAAKPAAKKVQAKPEKAHVVKPRTARKPVGGPKKGKAGKATRVSVHYVEPMHVSHPRNVRVRHVEQECDINAPIVKSQMYYIWTYGQYLVPVDRYVYIPIKNVDAVKGVNLLDAAKVAALYAKHGKNPNTIPTPLVVVDKATHEALRSFEDVRTGLSSDQWDEYLSNPLMGPTLFKCLRPLGTDIKDDAKMEKKAFYEYKKTGKVPKWYSEMKNLGGATPEKWLQHTTHRIHRAEH